MNSLDFGIILETEMEKVMMMAKQKLTLRGRSLLSTFLSGSGLLGSGIALLASGAVQGQMMPDETLGEERSQVSLEETIRDLPSRRIFGGAVRNSNLFHSFEAFSIDAGKGAYFINPTGVNNIFSRVTGGESSNILGRLGVLGSADLYFMNPNGIIFGPSASLDVQGSFTGTTADGIQFEDKGIFSALNPEVPSQLLTVNPSAYLFTQPEISSIQNAAQNITASPNQSFTLLGGDIVFQNGLIQAPSGGEIELGSVADVGSIRIDNSLGLPRLDFEENISRGNIFLNNGASVSVFGEGRIGIHAQDVSMSNGSAILSFVLLTPELGGIPVSNLTGRTGADIAIDAVGDIILTDLSLIASGILGGGDLLDRKDSGDIEISGSSVNLVNGSIIASTSVGQGDAGDVVIEATDSITLFGRGPNGNASGIGSPTASFSGFLGVGSGGDTTLRASRIDIRDGAVVSSISNAGAENAGNLDVFSSDTLSMSGGAFFSTATLGQGDAGFIKVHANNLISLDGVGTNGSITGFFSVVNPTENFQESRRGGNIIVTTLPSGSFNMTDGARISGNVESGAIGEAGNIDIQVGNMNLTNGSQVQSLLRGADAANNVVASQGRAGNLNIIVTGILTATGRDPNAAPSGFFTNAGLETVGSAGDIVVEAETINFDNSAISSITQSLGSAGFLDIQAQNIQLSNDALITSTTFGTGEGGNIKITADRLVARGGGQISAGSGRENISGDFGRSGNIDITIADLLELDSGGIENRSGIFAETSSPNRAGDLTINAGRLIVSNGAAVSASASGSGSKGGDSGILTIYASESVDVTGNGRRSSSLVTEANGIGNAGDLRLTTNRLTVREGGVITSATLGQGNAGDVEVNASDITVIGVGTNGEPSRILAAVEAGAVGEGGTIRIRTRNLTIEDSGRVSAASLTDDTAGDVIIDATGRITLRNGEIVTTAVGSSGGDILINTDPDSHSGILFLERNGDITTESLGNGGNITLLLPVVAFEDSDIIARSQGANGGNITLSAIFSDTDPLDSQEPFDGDGRVDVNADGELSAGNIAIPDTSFIESNLTELSDNLVDAESVVSDSCIVRSEEQSGTFSVTSRQGISNWLDSAAVSYSVGTVGSINALEQSSNTIEEPSGVYQMADGRLVMGRECS